MLSDRSWQAHRLANVIEAALKERDEQMAKAIERIDAVNQVDAIRKRFTDDQKEVAAIRERAEAEYRHEPGEQYTPMLRDIRFLLGQLNVIDGFWESAEKELKEIGNCDKCDLCEDHHA